MGEDEPTPAGENLWRQLDEALRRGATPLKAAPGVEAVRVRERNGKETWTLSDGDGRCLAGLDQQDLFLWRAMRQAGTADRLNRLYLEKFGALGTRRIADLVTRLAGAALLSEGGTGVFRSLEKDLARRRLSGRARALAGALVFHRIRLRGSGGRFAGRMPAATTLGGHPAPAAVLALAGAAGLAILRGGLPGATAPLLVIAGSLWPAVVTMLAANLFFSLLATGTAASALRRHDGEPAAPLLAFFLGLPGFSLPGQLLKTVDSRKRPAIQAGTLLAEFAAAGIFALAGRLLADQSAVAGQVLFLAALFGYLRVFTRLCPLAPGGGGLLLAEWFGLGQGPGAALPALRRGLPGRIWRGEKLTRPECGCAVISLATMAWLLFAAQILLRFFGAVEAAIITALLTATDPAGRALAWAAVSLLLLPPVIASLLIISTAGGALFNRLARRETWREPLRRGAALRLATGPAVILVLFLAPRARLPFFLAILTAAGLAACLLLLRRLERLRAAPAAIRGGLLLFLAGLATAAASTPHTTTGNITAAIAGLFLVISGLFFFRFDLATGRRRTVLGRAAAHTLILYAGTRLLLGAWPTGAAWPALLLAPGLFVSGPFTCRGGRRAGFRGSLYLAALSFSAVLLAGPAGATDSAMAAAGALFLAAALTTLASPATEIRHLTAAPRQQHDRAGSDRERLAAAFTAAVETAGRLLSFTLGPEPAARLGRDFQHRQNDPQPPATGPLAAPAPGPENETASVTALAGQYRDALNIIVRRVSRYLGPWFAERFLLMVHDTLPWEEREAFEQFVGLEARRLPLTAVSGAGLSRRDRRALLEGLLLFRGFPAAVLDEIAERVRLEAFPPGRNIITQGEPGDKFYLVLEGKVAVIRDETDGSTRTLACLEQGDYFGEEALLRRTARNATVRTIMPTRLLSLSREWFAALVTGRVDFDTSWRRHGETVAFLADLPLFRDFSLAAVRHLAGRLRHEQFPAGRDVVRQGDPGDRFYLVRRGELSVLTTDPEGREKTVARLHAGEYFGEIALLERIPRTATVRAESAVELFSLGGADFLDTIGGDERAAAGLEKLSSRRRKTLGR